VKTYGQILKGAIVAYIALMIAPLPSTIEPSGVSKFIHKERLLIGALLFLGYVGHAIADILLEDRSMRRREDREEAERAAEIPHSARQDDRALPCDQTIRLQGLSSEGMTQLWKFAVSFVAAVASLFAIILSESFVIKIAGTLSFAMTAVATRLFWISAVEAAARHYNLKKSYAYRRDIDSHVSRRQPFALYLHDFSSSSATEWSRSRPYVGSKTSRRRPSEERIVASVSELLPVFAFHSDLYPDAPPSRRFISLGDNWFVDFIQYSSAASLLLVDAEELSPGIESEISSIVGRSLGSKTVLFATPGELELLRQRCPEFVGQVKWSVEIGRRTHFEDFQLDFPKDILEEIKQSLSA